jgi:hypothetical protein
MSTSSEGGVARKPSVFALLFAPIPGLGHWAVRRGGRGFLTFALFAAGLNLVLLSKVIEPVKRIPPVWGWAIAGAAVLFSTVDVARIVFRTRAASVS